MLRLNVDFSIFDDVIDVLNDTSCPIEVLLRIELDDVHVVLELELDPNFIERETGTSEINVLAIIDTDVEPVVALFPVVVVKSATSVLNNLRTVDMIRSEETATAS